MSEEMEKVYCSGTDPATIAALMNNNGSDAATMAMLQNSNNMNNPMWLIWLIAMRWLGGNGDNNSDVESLRNQIADNQNANNMMAALQSNGAAMQDIANRTNTSIDFVRESLGALSTAVSNVAGQVGFSAERVINGVLLGNKDITAALQSCCCENKMLQMQNYAATQLQLSQNQASAQAGMENVRQAVVNGFANIGYTAAQNTCDLKTAISDGNQRIIDVLNNHWTTEQALALQDSKFKVSQMEQNQYLLSQLKSSCGCGN